MKLTGEQAKSKCKLGVGEACCAFLTFSDGWTCVKGTPLEAIINQRLAKGEMVAKGDYCNPGAGKSAIYSESGWVAKVEILEDNSDDEWYRYTLKVLKTLEDGIFTSPSDGHVFIAEADKKYMHYVDWTLMPEWKATDE